MKIITTAKFRPDGIENDVWENMSIQQKYESFEWTPFCFESDDVESFNKGTNPIYTTIRFKSGDSIQVRISFSDLLTLYHNRKEF